MEDYSDDALALEFAARCARTICFHDGQWLVWDPQAVARGAMHKDGPTVRGDWRPDDTMKVLRMIRDACRKVAADTDPKLRSRILSFSKLRAVERMARADLSLNEMELFRRTRELRSAVP